MKLKRILSVTLILSIIATSFSSVVQISAQTDEHASIQSAQVTKLEDDGMQTASRPVEPTKEFMINNETNFNEFMTKPEHWEIDFKVTLACNIDMKGKSFKPIKEFSGVFDGCGHTVSNMKIQNKSDKSKNSEIAFINTLNELAEIKNVTLDNYTVAGKSGIKKASSLVLTNHGIISDVDIINGEINSIDKKARTAGFVLSNEEDGLIENCFLNMNAKDSKIRSGFVGTNLGKITKCSTTLSANGKDLASGFVGENAGTIEKCNSKGNVESEKCAGGFCGKNSGNIIFCKSENNVTAKTKSTKVATICGGFVGENSGVIKEKCISSGKVEGQEFTGGFAGINNDDGEINSCNTTCDVKSHTYVASIHCGGFVGLDEGKIEKCNFDGNVDGRVDSEKVVGGVVGIAVGIIVIAAGIRLLVKKYYNTIPKLKNELDNAENNLNEAEIAYMELSNDVKLDGDKFLGELLEPEVHEDTITRTNLKVIDVFLKHKQKLLNHDKESIRTWAKYYESSILCMEAQNTYRIATASLKNNYIISLISVLVGGGALATASGITTELTAGRKCANVAGFCGFNIGEIIGCRANINSFKAKTLYNKHNMCGGFAGINGGIIKDSDATGKEICNETYTGGSLGGFVGENIGEIENGTTTISVANGKCTGGFCGSNSGEISGSKSKGNATADAKTLANKTKCGGFVGNNNEKGKIDDCTSSGSVTGQEYVGGFCGDNSGEVSKSKSSGDATAKTVSNTNICGGFVGNNDEKGNIDSCTSTGNTTGQEYVGGFAGINKSNIIDCNAHGKATSSTKTHTALAGGFVGENERGTIISCTATGGADSQSSSGQAKAGGFVGVNKANIMNSKASGYVYLSAGTCHKDDGCGGFVGKNDKGGSIDGCYAECTIETTNNKKGGGFVGEAKNKSTIINSKCKSKIVTKAGIKDNRKFCQDKDKKAVIENCYAN